MPRGASQDEIGAEKPPQDPPARSGVVGAMVVAVLLGAGIGAVLAAVFLPDLMVASALGGAMIFGAARVFIFLSPNRKGLAPVEDENGSFK